ncbi:hypothetical protein [Streptomyces sp. NRRL WC-3742]|uniref:hypothetical protein n=1 Tax=Streptomyces sp. NRRL WC-3742 TaxID=1463934 RepID=UPI0004C7084B|nr:hypothetical protein [Streptomyces sp. NRRL WC-3742]
MTTTAAATAATAVDRPLGRAVRLVPAGPTGFTGFAGFAGSASEDTHDRAAEADPDLARTRPAHCRFALHLED